MRHLLVGDVLLEHLQLLPELGVLLLAHELDQLPLSLKLLLDGAEISNFLLCSVLKLLKMFASVLLGLKSNKKSFYEHEKCLNYINCLILRTRSI